MKHHEITRQEMMFNIIQMLCDWSAFYVIFRFHLCKKIDVYIGIKEPPAGICYGILQPSYGFIFSYDFSSVMVKK